MEEAYHLCDEIAIMDHGRIIAQGTPHELLEAHFDDVVLQLPAADFPDPPPRCRTHRGAAGIRWKF